MSVRTQPGATSSIARHRRDDGRQSASSACLSAACWSCRVPRSRCYRRCCPVRTSSRRSHPRPDQILEDFDQTHRREGGVASFARQMPALTKRRSSGRSASRREARDRTVEVRSASAFRRCESAHRPTARPPLRQRRHLPSERGNAALAPMRFGRNLRRSGPGRGCDRRDDVRRTGQPSPVTAASGTLQLSKPHSTC